MPSKRARKEVVEQLISEYSTLATLTSFTEHELEQIFSLEEMEAINDLLLEMKSASDENDKRAKLIGNIDKYAGVLLKMVRKMGPVPV